MKIYRNVLGVQIFTRNVWFIRACATKLSLNKPFSPTFSSVRMDCYTVLFLQWKFIVMFAKCTNLYTRRLTQACFYYWTNRQSPLSNHILSTSMTSLYPWKRCFRFFYLVLYLLQRLKSTNLHTRRLTCTCSYYWTCTSYLCIVTFATLYPQKYRSRYSFRRILQWRVDNRAWDQWFLSVQTEINISNCQLRDKHRRLYGRGLP